MYALNVMAAHLCGLFYSIYIDLKFHIVLVLSLG